jgi:hypothetical protein
MLVSSEKGGRFWGWDRRTPSEVARQCRDGLAKGYHVFYLKVGLDIEAELEMVRGIR